VNLGLNESEPGLLTAPDGDRLQRRWARWV